MSLDQLKEEHKRPNVEPFKFYVDSFWELSTCRNYPENGSIPFMTVVEFAKIYNIEDFDDFLYYIRVMDQVYLEHYARKQKNDGRQN